MKKLLILLSVTVLVMIITPILIYFYNFNTGQLSTNNQDWGNFGDYINGTLSPVIAFLGVVVSFLIWFISHIHNKTIIEKQEMEKRPLANISYSDFEEKLEVNLWNKGLGPLIVVKYLVRNTTTNEERSGIYDWISDLGFQLNNYSGNQDNLVLRPGDKINLIRLLQEKESEQTFSVKRQKLRETLQHLEVEIEYDDIYNRNRTKYKRQLKWFGRHFTDATTKKGSS